MTPFLGVLFLVIYAIVVVYPIWKILGRMGFSGLWGLLALVPVANLIALWILAYTAWPNTEAAGEN